MTHEMLHLAFPEMGEDRLWMNEGMSVYLEPIVRSRAEIISPERYWKELIEGLPSGQPEAGDGGLNQTHSWGRTYWGGTMFWFLADVKIREATNNRRSLDDAVRAILDAGGDGSQSWEVKRVFAVADRATGTHLLDSLYDELAQHPGRADLESWYRKLGVRYSGGEVTFDDSAPMAAARRSITVR